MRRTFDRDVLIQDMYGEPLISGWWAAAGVSDLGLALPYERLEGHLERMKGLA